MFVRFLYSLSFTFFLSAFMQAKTETIDCARPTVTARNSISEIAKAYREFLLSCHPDKRKGFASPKQIHDEFIKGEEAYSTLLQRQKEPFEMKEPPFYSMKEEKVRKTGFARPLSPLDEELVKAVNYLNQDEVARLLKRGAKVSGQSLVKVIEMLSADRCLSFDGSRPMLALLIEHISDPNITNEVVNWEECYIAGFLEETYCDARTGTFFEYVDFKLKEKGYFGERRCKNALSSEEAQAIFDAVNRAKQQSLNEL